MSLVPHNQRPATTLEQYLHQLREFGGEAAVQAALQLARQLGLHLYDQLEQLPDNFWNALEQFANPPQHVMDERARLARQPWDLDRPSHELLQDPRVNQLDITDTSLSLPILPPMDNNADNKRPRTDDNTITALRSSANDPNRGYEETRIEMHKPNYMLQDTHTTIIPFDIYFSIVTRSVVGGTPWSTPTEVQVRMTSIVDPMITSMTAATTAALTQGVYNNYIVSGGSTSSVVAEFPNTITAGTSTGEYGHGKAFWTKIYQYYSVIQCDWTLTSAGGELNQPNCAMVCLHTYAGTTPPTTGKYTEMRAYKGIKETQIKGGFLADQHQGVKTYVSGTYKPGDFKREVKDDAAVQKWTSTGSAQSYTEKLCLYFFPDPINLRTPITASTGFPIQQFRLTLKMIVQFKDLVSAFKWPNDNTAPVSVTSDDLFPTY